MTLGECLRERSTPLELRIAARLRVGSSALGLLLLPWTAGAAPGESRTVVYACDDKSTLTVEYVTEPSPQANVTRYTSTWTLPQVRSGSGARYADDEVSVWSKGDEVLFENVASKLKLECTAQQ